MNEPLVQGQQENIKKLQDIEKKLNQSITKAMKQSAELLKTEIENKVPLSDVEHMHIKNDINLSKLTDKDGEKAITVGPDKTAWRAKFLEFGTEKMKAQPFMTEAYKNTEKEIEVIINAAIKQSLKG